MTAPTQDPPQASPEKGAPSTNVLARRKRLTLAVLFDNANFFAGCYEASLREALDRRCQDQGHDLLLVYGGSLEAPGPAAAADNAIFRVLGPASADGIIVVSSMLAGFCGPEPVARLVESYRPAPLCSIGLALPGVPSLIVDNRGGMVATVEHMVREHGVRRPVFLAGPPNNPEAQERLEAYKEVLDKHGISFDPALVACGYFMPRQGRDAMEAVLTSGIEFDGVVAANDNMALGAIEALRKWGRRVPRDVPVTGFDGLPLAALGNPPLTTVAQPLDRMADLAIDLVLAQLGGEQVPERTVLPSRFVRRRSCGCEYEARPRSITPAVDACTASASLDRIEALQPRLAGALYAHSEHATLVSRRLTEALRSEVAGQRRAFAKAVADLLEDIGERNLCHAILHEAIGWLRDELADLGDLGLERAFYDGLGLVASSSTTMQERQRLTQEDNYATLLDVGEQASVAFDLSSLAQTLSKGLPASGIRTAFLSSSLARDTRVGELSPLVTLVDGRATATVEPSFPACLLIPPLARQLGPRRTFLVFPLALDAQLLGVVAFDYADGVHSCTVFRNEITAVLKSIRLHEELMQKTMLHERSVQERLAATKRMEALSVLAGGVAHDLNNALGPLVALPDLILRELGNLGGDPGSCAKLSGDVELIKTAAQRAAQTIKDLLTLGRQGRVVKETVDLNRVVKSCVAEGSLRLVEDKTRVVEVVADYANEPLTVRAAEAQLARAVGNLLGNAIDAIEDRGQIRVTTRRERLTEPAVRYETIPAGEYAVLTVADDGCGIAAGDLGRVFEPFFSRKRAGARSGSGLGLAIVHGVVNEHAGFIDVVSAPGRGTTFALYFPAVTGAPVVAAPLRSGRPGRAKILVVDDEVIQLRTCRRILLELGYEVDTMESGLRAYHVFKRAAASGASPYDLVVIDMTLGELMDGVQVFELIQRLFTRQKVIVASGHALPERAGLASTKGLVWLAKPYTVPALARAVEQVLADE